MTVWTWLIGLGAGTVFGVYLAQNYQVPNVVELVGKASDVAASYQNKPPPSSPDNPPPSDSSDPPKSDK